MGTMERRVKDKQRRREDILVAARALLRGKGYQSMTMDDIARATELARGTVYLYFESKEEIYAAILEDGIDVLFGLISASYNTEADPLTNLLAAHDAAMRFQEEHLHYYDVLLLDRLHIETPLPAPFRQRYTAKMKRLVDHFARILEQGIAQGYFRPMNTERGAHLQMGIGIGISQLLDPSFSSGSEVLGDRAEMRQAIHELVANSVVVRGNLPQKKGV